MSRFGESPSAVTNGGGSGGEIMLFGVRVKVDPIRKSLSMNNISEFLPVVTTSGVSNNDENFPKATVEDGVAAGYASADDAIPLPRSGSRDRNRGVPWTEEEHKLFIYGLQKVGKGNWRGISRDYVKTRTPTQVASHAQKYFFRRRNLNHRRRRSSVFDFTTESVAAMTIEQAENQHDNPVQRVPPPTAPPLPLTSTIAGISVVTFPPAVGPVLYRTTQESPALGYTDRANNPSAMLVSQVQILPMPTSSAMMDVQQVLIQPSPLSYVISLKSSQDPFARQILA